ncbi:hypothetical protein ACLB2K_050680 [Fragaria x ananassa]
MAFAAAPRASHTLSLLGTPNSRRATTKTRTSSRHVNHVATFHVDASTSSSQAEGPSKFLGVSAEADLEQIKAAYRRLSKEYHPDTTSLPLQTASDKFVRLREIYDVLSNEESRRFYNWTLAQEAASRQAEMMRMRLEDPY